MAARGKASAVFRRAPLLFSIAASILFAIWPLFISVLESFDVDIGPLFSGRGITFIGGVPFYSGGFNPNLANLYTALSVEAFPTLVLHSLAIDFLSIGIALAAGTPAAFFLARSRARRKSVIEFLVLALRTVSPFALVIPLYILFSRNGLWNTYPGVAIAYLTIDLPIVVWMMKGFFADVPKEVYEAAEISGASEMKIFWRIAMPHVVFGIIATSIFTFVLLWNEFLFADLLTGGATKTVSIGIWNGAGENIVAYRTLSWDMTNMFGTLAFIPAFAVVVTIRRYIVRAFTYATV
jgi:multiple sugar transport system permease protein